VWFAVLLGVLLGVVLARAAWLDLRAARQGKRYVPVPRGRFRRTRFELVEREGYDERRRQQLYEQTVDQQRKLREEPVSGYLLPRLTRRRGSPGGLRQATRRKD
jgi:hypothetical protein